MKDASCKIRHSWKINVNRNLIEKNGNILTVVIWIRDVVKMLMNHRIPSIACLSWLAKQQVASEAGLWFIDLFTSCVGDANLCMGVFRCVYLTCSRCLSPDYCVLISYMSVAYYRISMGLTDTCPLLLIRLPWVYLTRARYTLSDFCVFDTCVLFNTRFMCLTRVPSCYLSSVCLFDTCPLPVTRAVRLSKSTHFLTFLFCVPEVAQQIPSFCGLLSVST
jgi:hypothetical protein